MKTLLVPVDFSTTSDHTLNYVTAFCKDAPVGRIILLKSCYTSMYAEMLPSIDYVQVNGEYSRQERHQTELHVTEIASQLQQRVGSDIKVKTAISRQPLLRAIQGMIAQEQPDLMIIGSDGNRYVDESYIGEQAIGIARTSTISVLVVPSGYVYEPVKRVVLANDYKTILKTKALQALEKRYDWLKPQILVLSVNTTKEPATNYQERSQIENHLQQLLRNYDYQLHYVNNRNALNAITGFSSQHQAQMIIALPGKHSFLYSLTHRSITDGLSAQAKQPVLILK